MKKILNCVEPAIRTYLGDAFCFSIINEFAFSKGWVYDKYINIQYNPDDQHIKYADYDYYDFVAGEGVFIKSFTQIPISKCNQQFICKVIEQMIDDEEYFFALFDENVVTNYLFGKQSTETFEHGCFIYGYDSIAKDFFMEGYVKDEKWEKYEIPYDVFYKALSYYPEKGEIAFIGYQMVKNYDWSFDYKRMYCSLQNYMNERECKDLLAIRRFFEDIIDTKIIHYPSAYCLLEHKRLMKKRILFLIAERYISLGQAQLQLFDEIEKDYEKILMLVIKYNVVGMEKILKKIYRLGTQALGKEYDYMKLLFGSLPI